MDMGAMKGSLVGQSEQYFRQAMKVIDAVGQDRVLYIATCNDITSLPPALRRRFTLGTFYFDLPTYEEGVDIWAYYLKKYSLKGDSKMLAKTYLGWTGADIFNCCKRAWMFKVGVDEAAKYATPVCETDPAGIEKLRNLADGKFLSANYEGKYMKNKDTVKIGKERKMRFD
jgi:SpoVK/Ycf46/Vps4 family AAA+-type ATPase